MINIIIIALFNYVFLGTEYMYDNMMLYVINSNGVVNAQNYILGVSVAGFLMYPLLKRVYRKNNNMLLLHIFKVCVVITGIICIAVMGTHSSYVSIFISGCVFFAIMGIVSVPRSQCLGRLIIFIKKRDTVVPVPIPNKIPAI